MSEPLIPERYIHTGGKRRRPALCRGIIQKSESVDRHTVRHHNAVKAHFPAQYIAQKPRIIVTRNPVNIIVRRHDTGGSCLYRRIRRRQMNLTQLPLSYPRGAGVHAAGGLSLRRKMLRHNVHTLRAVAADDLPRKLRSQICILAKALLAPSPARVAQHIKHGNERQVDPQLFHLPRARTDGPPGKLWIPGRPDSQIDRQQIAVQRLMPVRTLFRDQHRNPEARLCDHIFLHKIVCLHGKVSRQSVLIIAPGPGVGAVQPVQHADSAIFLRLPAKFLRELQTVFAARADAKPVQPLVKLTHLFRRRHVLQQIPCPRTGRKRSVFIFFHTYFSTTL